MLLSKKAIFATAISGLMMGGTAYAQSAPDGSELRGHIVDVVFGDGTRNSVYFAPNGQAQITGPDVRADANWAVRGNQLCLNNGSMQECWNYSRRFAAGETLSLSSSCDEASRWTARSVNPPPAPPAPVQKVAPVQRGERG